MKTASRMDEKFRKQKRPDIFKIQRSSEVKEFSGVYR